MLNRDKTFVISQINWVNKLQDKTPLKCLKNRKIDIS